MSRKDKSHEARGPQQGRPTEAAQPHGPRARWFTPIKIGIGLGVVVLGAAALLGPMLRGRDRARPPESPTRTAPSGDAALLAGLRSLPPPAPDTRVPVNDVDPVTGKPLTPSSPTTTYKGYVIGFCCTESAGYRGGWERMREAEKDAFVRRYLR